MITHGTPPAATEAGPNLLKISESDFWNRALRRAASEQVANGLLPFCYPTPEYRAGRDVTTQLQGIGKAQ